MQQSQPNSANSPSFSHAKQEENKEKATKTQAAIFSYTSSHIPV